MTHRVNGNNSIKHLYRETQAALLNLDFCLSYKAEIECIKQSMRFNAKFTEFTRATGHYLASQTPDKQLKCNGYVIRLSEVVQSICITTPSKIALTQCEENTKTLQLVQHRINEAQQRQLEQRSESPKTSKTYRDNGFFQPVNKRYDPETVFNRLSPF